MCSIYSKRRLQKAKKCGGFFDTFKSGAKLLPPQKKERGIAKSVQINKVDREIKYVQSKRCG
jgi:hypothetical protein